MAWADDPWLWIRVVASTGMPRSSILVMLLALGMAPVAAQPSRGLPLSAGQSILEADAVLGLLSDSDFAGGGTDGKGHILTGAYGINKQWSLGLTSFLNNEAGEKNLADQGGALSYDRIQLDTKFKY